MIGDARIAGLFFFLCLKYWRHVPSPTGTLVLCGFGGLSSFLEVLASLRPKPLPWHHPPAL